MPSAAITWILLSCYLLSSWNGMSLGQGVSYGKPSIQVVPSNVIIKGGDFTIRCRGPLAGVTFLLFRGSEVIQTLRPTGNEAEFHFSNAQQRHTGTYICRYNPTSDLSVYSDSSDAIDIQVRDTFPEPSLQVSPGTVAVRGGTLTFRCRGEHPDMRFTLRKGGTELQTEEPHGNEAVFTISDVQQKHGGSYDCIYQTKSTPTVYSDPSFLILLRVRDTFPEPSLQASPGTVAMRGGTLTFTCTGEHPDMRFTLRMGRTELQTDEPRGNEAVFTISDVQQKHGGSYDCIYQTKSVQILYSDPSDAILIRVRDTFPKPSLQASPGTVAVRGGTLTFRCTGEHPDMRFTLRKGGTELQTEEPRGNEAVFTIRDVQQKDEGSYDCIYQTKSAPTIYSDPSDSILLRVRGTEPDEGDAKPVDECLCGEPDFSQRIIIQSVMVAVVLLVLLVILVEHFHSIKKKHA